MCGPPPTYPRLHPLALASSYRLCIGRSFPRLTCSVPLRSVGVRGAYGGSGTGLWVSKACWAGPWRRFMGSRPGEHPERPGLFRQPLCSHVAPRKQTVYSLLQISHLLPRPIPSDQPPAPGHLTVARGSCHLHAWLQPPCSPSPWSPHVRLLLGLTGWSHADTGPYVSSVSCSHSFFLSFLFF